MAEDFEGQEAGSGAGSDPAAVAVALGSASRSKADRFLEEQTALAADQRHHLREQFKQLKLNIWQQRMGVLLRVATAAMGLAAAAGIALMLWNAAHSRGLLIEPFSVPPDFAGKGLTGQAVASQLLDRLSAMQRGTESARPPQSYSNNWGDDLKVEIPETGLSLGELQRLLREWLGHDTRITGEVWHTPKGIAMIARASGSDGEPVVGDEAGLDDVLQKVAENVYRATQPYRYANYLDRDTYRAGAQLRFAEAEAIYKQLIYDPNPVEQAWAWNGLGTLAWNAQGNIEQAIVYYRKSLAIQPDFAVAWSAYASQEWLLSRPEDAIIPARNYVRVSNPANSTLNVQPDLLFGDYADLLRIGSQGAERANSGAVFNRDFYQGYALMALASQHDAKGARAWLVAMPPVEARANNCRAGNWKMQTFVALADWQAAAAFEPEAEKACQSFTPTWDLKAMFARQLRPGLALAKARLGDVAGGETLIAASPADCYDCTRVRALIADAGQQPGRADYWFAKAVHDDPSIPFAYADWGKSLLARAQTDAAIAQFKLSSAKGPHFADPLEGWGEALMAKKDSGAAAKFAEAEKYAPNWGRLHLKWGEALASAGKPDEAKKQFALAAGLDLAAADKAELERMTAGSS